MDLNQNLPDDKDLQVDFVVVPECATQIQYGRRPPSWKIKNQHIFTIIWPILMNLKIQYGRWQPFWKIEELLYPRNHLTDFDEIWNGDASAPIPVRALKFLILKSKMAHVFQIM